LLELVGKRHRREAQFADPVLTASTRFGDDSRTFAAE